MRIPRYTLTFSDETTTTAIHRPMKPFQHSMAHDFAATNTFTIPRRYQDSHYSVYGVDSHLSDLV